MNTNATTIKVASLDEQRQWALDIVTGVIKRTPNDPLIWCTSLDVAKRLMSDERSALRNAIRELHGTAAERLALVI